MRTVNPKLTDRAQRDYMASSIVWKDDVKYILALDGKDTILLGERRDDACRSLGRLIAAKQAVTSKDAVEVTRQERTPVCVLRPQSGLPGLCA